MTRQERYRRALDTFRATQPNVTTELLFASAFQLLVATVLSAQCTDKRVNQVTVGLFARYPDARAMAQAEPDDLLEHISSVSYPNAKARHLVALARGLMAEHGGEAGRRAKDGQRRRSRMVRTRHHGRRHTRLPRGASHGTGAQDGQHAAKGGTLPHGTHTPSGHTQRTPLAIAPRTLHLQERQAALWRLPIWRMVPQAIGWQQVVTRSFNLNITSP